MSKSLTKTGEAYNLLKNYSGNNYYLINLKNDVYVYKNATLSDFQIEILKDLGVEEVIIALDKEYEHAGTDEEKLYENRLRKTISNRLNFCTVSLLWDVKGLLKQKESPLDRGKEVFLDLFLNRKYLY